MNQRGHELRQSTVTTYGEIEFIRTKATEHTQTWLKYTIAKDGEKGEYKDEKVDGILASSDWTKISSKMREYCAIIYVDFTPIRILDL